MTEISQFYDLARKAASGTASTAEEAELKSRMARDVKLKAKYERFRKDFALVKNILPLLEAAEAPRQEIPASVLARLNKKVQEASSGFDKESLFLESLLQEMRDWAQSGPTTAARQRRFELIAEIPFRLSEILSKKTFPHWGKIEVPQRWWLENTLWWGEETLWRVVEAAGMSAHCDFHEQTHSGETKPDLTVHLPGGRIIIVDAKVPSLDFLKAIDAADPVKRAEALTGLAANLKTTIRALAEQDYPRQFPAALDSVVLFFPAESLLGAALEGDRDLIVWAAQKQIMLATPASLIGLLRAVSVIWQQHAQLENAREVGKTAQEMYTHVAKFFEHLKEIRPGLKGASSAFNDAVDSYARMVQPSGERLFRLLAGATSVELPDVKALAETLSALVHGQK